MFWAFLSLRHLMVTCILKSKRQRTFVAYCFRLLLNKGLHYGQLLREFLFILYTQSVSHPACLITSGRGEGKDVISNRSC